MTTNTPENSGNNDSVQVSGTLNQNEVWSQTNQPNWGNGQTNHQEYSNQSKENESNVRRKHTTLALIGLPLAFMLIIMGSLIVSTIYLTHLASQGEDLLSLSESDLMGIFMEPPLLSILLVMQFAAFAFVVFLMKGLADATSFTRFFYPSTYKGFSQKMGLPTSFGITFWKHVVIGLGIGIALFVGLLVINYILYFIGHTPESSETSEQLAQSGSWLLLLLVVPILGPFVEELFFRGYMMSYLTNRGRDDVQVSRARAITAVIVTSLLFGVMHFQGLSSFNDVFVIFWTGLLGAVLAITYLKTSKITIAIVAHMVYNGISVLAMIGTGLISVGPFLLI